MRPPSRRARGQRHRRARQPPCYGSAMVARRRGGWAARARAVELACGGSRAERCAAAATGAEGFRARGDEWG
uniref:Uncharacterized protein n=1 Tax=Arundo donax TaxID=35708 RepID=A0A0A9F1R3_ARUDO